MSYAPKILIVDDEPRMCESLKTLLNGRGYEIHTSNSGKETIEQLSRGNFDLIILDIVMPDMDGFKVMEHIKDRGLNTLVIVMTGNASIESAVEALRKGAYDYLRKPFEHEELLKTINNALDQKGLESDLNLSKRDLNESEEKWRSLTENSADHIMLLDLDYNIQFINHTVPDLTIEEVIGRSNMDFVPPDQHQVAIDCFERVIQSGKPDRYETQYITVEGETQDFDVRVAPVMGKDGRVAWLISSSNNVTERKKTEEALRESEARLVHSQRLAHLGSYQFEVPEGEVVWSDETYRIVGRDPMEGEPSIEEYYKIIHPDDLLRVQRVIEKSIDEAKMFNFEYRIMMEDGSIRHIQSVGEPIVNRFGIVEGIFGTIHDITERKRTEEKLQESEERFRDLIEGSIQGILIHRDFKPLFLNEAYADIHGYTVDEILRLETFPTLIAPNERSRIAEIQTARMQDKEAPIQYEYQGLRKDGSSIWIDNLVRVIEWEGQPAIQTTIIDISKRKQAEEELRKSEEHYRILLGAADRAGQAIILHQDIEGKEAACVFTNETVSNITGYSREELSNLSWMDLLHPKYRDIALQRYRKRMAGDVIQDIFEISIITKEGREVPIEIFSTQSEYQGDIALISFFRDITDRKKLEEILLKTNKLESLGTLSGGLAHDFNNLLSIIMVNLSLAEEDIKSKTGALKFLKAAEDASIRAKDLTARLITFSKGGEPVKRVVSIEYLLKDSVSASLSGSDIDCKFSIPDDLSSVNIDQGQMKQVIHNIVINAHEAMAGEGTIKVDCENVTIGENDALTLESGKHVKISITDQGTGIPEENLAKIFDPYFSTKEMGEVKGMGLGLSSCHSIVENHNGLITVESELGVGTTLSIYLPASDKEIKEPVPVRQPISEKPVTGKGKVLLMDDEQMIRDYAVPVLSQLGYDAEVSKDGAEAIELYIKARESGAPFDVVILDLTCQSGMGGKEAIEKLLEIDPNVKAIVSTGYSSNPVMTNFLEYGFCGALSKPYTTGELSKVIKDVFFQERKGQMSDQIKSPM